MRNRQILEEVTISSNGMVEKIEKIEKLDIVSIESHLVEILATASIGRNEQRVLRRTDQPEAFVGIFQGQNYMMMYYSQIRVLCKLADRSSVVSLLGYVSEIESYRLSAAQYAMVRYGDSTPGFRIKEDLQRIGLWEGDFPGGQLDWARYLWSFFSR